MQRIELACHTGYSRMNGIGMVNDWVKFAGENDIHTLVITDDGNVDSYADFQQYIQWKRNDIKLIMGADIETTAIIKNDKQGTENSAGIITGRLSVLIENETGKKNLYKLLSKDSDEIFLRDLLSNREGILIGSGSSDSLLFKTFEGLKNCSESTENKDIKDDDAVFLGELYNALDYIEIPDTGVDEQIINQALALADFLDIPAAAVAAPHYTYRDMHVAYSVLTCNNEAPYLHYKTTDEMLQSFDFLGKEKAYEIVVENTNRIASMCKEVPAVPKEKYYLNFKNQDEILREACYEALDKKYPDAASDVKDRLEWELKAVSNYGNAFMFLQIKDVIERLDIKPFEITARGAVGSSIVAYLCGITEIDPIKAKLSPYFFFGFEGNREPDIDLNFRSGIQAAAHRAFEKAPGVGTMVHAGSFSYLSRSDAEELLGKYNEYTNGMLKDPELAQDIIDCLSEVCVKERTRHPGGLVLLPKEIEVTDICPVVYVGDGEDRVLTTAFDYHGIDGVVYIFHALEHSSCEMIKYLYDATGVDPRSISLEDEEVLEAFLKEPYMLPDIGGIPEFNTDYALNVLKAAKPKNFDDLVSICGLVHGTENWEDNAELLIRTEMAEIYEVIADRNDVYDTLMLYGMDEETAFKIAEDVRKGKVYSGKSRNWEKWKKQIFDLGVPEWFVWSCERIRYLFPKAHCYGYMMNSWRLMWYRLHFPEEYEKALLIKNKNH